jgi:MYXO-CTERM domain-containing protein
MTPWRLVPVVLLVACDPWGVRDGTAVGNPGNLGMEVIDVPKDISLERATAEVAGVLLIGCEGHDEWVEVGAIVDLLGSDDSIAIPGGTYCAASVELASVGSPVVLDGVTDGGTRFEVALDVDILLVPEPFVVDATLLLVGLSLNGALDATTLEALGSDVAVPATDPIAQTWADAATAGPQLWIDVDGDGGIADVDERIVDGSVQAYSASESGCGCRTPAGGSSGILALLAAWGLARRRRASHDGAH